MATRQSLIVDDSATARHMLGRMLKKMDFSIQQAASGEDALELLRSTRPDIIFLDHIMPGMDGFQVLKALKSNELTASIPVIMYTSQSATKYKEEAISLGAVGVISKQLDDAELSSIIDTILADDTNGNADAFYIASNDFLSGYGPDAPQTTSSSSRVEGAEDGPVTAAHTAEAATTSNTDTNNITSIVHNHSQTKQKSFLRRYPLSAAVIGLLIFIPTKMIINLSDQVENQQREMKRVTEAMQDSQWELTQTIETLSIEISRERQTLEEEKAIVTELILNLAEQVVQNTNASKQVIAEQVSEPSADERQRSADQQRGGERDTVSAEVEERQDF